MDTVGAEDLASAKRHLQTEHFDLILLGCNLPDENGIDFCRELMKSVPLPVIFLAVRDSEIDEVAAFRAETCDYVKKPFSLMVLRERIAALLERGEKRSDFYMDRRYRFDFAALDFSAGDEKGSLGATEIRLLAVLVKNAGHVLSRVALTDALVKLSRCEGGLIEENVHPAENFIETLAARPCQPLCPGRG